MQGVGSKLEEKYIVPVARELAAALKAIHAIGIIHRDVKCKPFSRKSLPDFVVEYVCRS